MAGATSVVIVRTALVGPDGRVLVLRRAKDDENNPGRVDFPGGGVEPGESFLAAAVREIKEEADLTVAEGELQLAHEFSRPADTKIKARMLFVAHVTATDVRLSREHDAYSWHAPEETRQLFADTSWAEAIDIAMRQGLLA